MKELDDFTKAYIECALWSTNDNSTPEGGEPLDRNFSEEDIHPDTLQEITEDCRIFQERNEDDILSGPLSPHEPYTASIQAGHDFWLTRNHHGAGFWDGDWPEPAATRLDKACQEAGDVSLYIGDDDKIHH